MFRGISILIAVPLSCIAFMSLIVYVAASLGIPKEHLHGPTFVLSGYTVACTLLVLLGPVAIIVLAQKHLLRFQIKELGFARPLWKPLALGVGCGLIIQGANYFVKGALAGGASFQSVLPEYVTLGMYGLYIAWFLIALVLNSLSEELVFRVFPLQMLQRMNMRPWLTIVITSVAFSAVHFLTSEASIANFLFRTLYGILFCQIFLATKSLWLITGLHTGTNLLASALSNPWRMGGIVEVTWLSSPEIQAYSFTMVLMVCVIGWEWRSRQLKEV